MSNENQLIRAIEVYVGANGDDGKGPDVGMAPADTCCCDCCDCCIGVGRHMKMLESLREIMDNAKSFFNQVGNLLNDEKSKLYARVINHGHTSIGEHINIAFDIYGCIFRWWIDSVFPDVDDQSPWLDGELANEIKALNGSIKKYELKSSPIKRCWLFLHCNCRYCCGNNECSEYYDCLTCGANANKYIKRLRRDLLALAHSRNIFSLTPRMRDGELVDQFGISDVLKGTKMYNRMKNIHNIMNKVSEIKVKEIKEGKIAPESKDTVVRETIREFSGEADEKVVTQLIDNLLTFYGNSGLPEEIADHHIAHGGLLWKGDSISISKSIWKRWIDHFCNRANSSEIINLANKVRKRRKCFSSSVICCIGLLITLGTIALIGLAIYKNVN